MTSSPFDFLSSLPQLPTAQSTARSLSLFQNLALANTPEQDLTHAGRKAGKESLSQGAPAGPEFERIQALPTRDWRDAYDVPALIEQYTREFRFDGQCSVDESARLLPMQAVALHELRTYGRLYVVAGLGTGKTLLSGLVPTLLGCTADDTLYLPPARLEEKTKTELGKLYIQGWRVTPPKHVLSAETLSQASQANVLFELRPRCIVLDESHTFANPKSGRSKRLQQFLTAAAEAGHKVHVVPMTGSPGDSTLKTVLHLMRWSVSAEHAPLPMDRSESWVWCQCLDADTGFDVNTKKSRRRPPPGKLVEFLAPGDRDGPTLDNIRHGVGRRIESTPGVLYYRTDDVAAQLRITDIRYDRHSRRLREEFAAARSGDELTDGRVLDVPVLDSVLFQTLGLGFARVIDPPPPVEWRDARREYNSLVREILDDESSGLHTPGQVALRFASAKLEDTTGSVARWRAIEPTFEKHRKTVWIDDSALEFFAEAALRGGGEAAKIFWVAYPDFGRKLAELTGMPFFHAGGIDQKSGLSIDNYRPGVDGPRHVIASINANATGRNLQDRWHSNTVIGCPAKADLLQQLIGRTHRRGQQAECVDVHVFMSSVENPLALAKARERALVDRSLGRALQSRLLDCAWDVAPLALYIVPGDPVWSSRSSRFAESESESESESDLEDE